MFKEIKIGNNTVPMLANGATALRYRLVFNKDLISEFMEAQNDTSKGFNALPELSFIMAMAAKAKEGKVDMNRLNQDSFLEWLEEFEPTDIAMAADDIMAVYIGNGQTNSEPKKKEEEK